MELGCRNDVDNSTADRYLLLNRKADVNIPFFIKVDIGIPMLVGYNEVGCIDIDLMQISSLGDEIPLPKRRRPIDVG